MRPHLLPSSRFVAILVTLMVAVGLVGAPTPAGADEVIDELERRRAETQRDVEAAGTTVDALGADVGEALAELDRLAAASERADLEAQVARTIADAAAQAAASSSVSADLASEALGGLRQRLSALAVERYVAGPGDGLLARVVEGDVFADARRDVVLATAAGEDLSAAEAVDLASQTLDARRDAAALTTTLAQRLSAEASQLGAAAETAEAEWSEWVESLQDRLDRALVEAAALDQLDAGLAAQIRIREIELAEQLRARQAALARRAPPRPSETVKTAAVVDATETVVVRGLRVHHSVAANVDAMLAHAERDGIVLGGGGWRDGDAQLRLRRSHCGSTDYDIYQRPAGECRPPTARPGRSMHEQGLALDLTHQGRAIVTRDDDAYRWLAANAATYGFYNLPSEPWHWSTNGR